MERVHLWREPRYKLTTSIFDLCMLAHIGEEVCVGMNSVVSFNVDIPKTKELTIVFRGRKMKFVLWAVFEVSSISNILFAFVACTKSIELEDCPLLDGTWGSCRDFFEESMWWYQCDIENDDVWGYVSERSIRHACVVHDSMCAGLAICMKVDGRERNMSTAVVLHMCRMWYN